MIFIILSGMILLDTVVENSRIINTRLLLAMMINKLMMKAEISKKRPLITYPRLTERVAIQSFNEPSQVAKDLPELQKEAV